MDIKTKAEDFLLDLGVAPQLKGFALLVDAVTLCAEEANLALGITKLNNIIAERNQDTASRVERAMRHSIDKTVEREPEKCAEIFRGRKPTSSEFIATAALYVRREGALK